MLISRKLYPSVRPCASLPSGCPPETKTPQQIAAEKAKALQLQLAALQLQLDAAKGLLASKQATEAESQTLRVQATRLQAALKDCNTQMADCESVRRQCDLQKQSNASFNLNTRPDQNHIRVGGKHGGAVQGMGGPGMGAPPPVMGDPAGMMGDPAGMMGGRAGVGSGDDVLRMLREERSKMGFTKQLSSDCKAYIAEKLAKSDSKSSKKLIRKLLKKMNACPMKRITYEFAKDQMNKI